MTSRARFPGRSVRRMRQSRPWRRHALAGFMAVAASLSVMVMPRVPASALASPRSARSDRHAKPAEFYVGFAKANITPDVPFSYLGGNGYQRVGTKVENPLYERAVAIAPVARDGASHGVPVVVVSVDSQGYFLAYQGSSGPLSIANYGYAQIAAAAATATGIPASHVIFSSTHSHTAPDTIGAWGGSPTSYFDLVRSAAIKVVKAAVASMQPAWLRRGTANGASYVYNPIPTAISNSAGDNHKTWPVDGTVTVLQALAWRTTTPLVTVVNFGVHPDILESTTLISPDWPAWMISALSAAEGGHTMFLQGTLGSEPVLPASDGHPTEYSGVATTSGSVTEAKEYGEAIAGVAESAISHASPITSGRLSVAAVPIAVPATNAAILALDDTNPPSQVQAALGLGHIRRADVPPYLTGNVVGSVVSVVRIGDGALFDMPGEIFDDVLVAASRQVRSAWSVPVGLADDQLGYVVMPDEWPVMNAAGGATGPNAEFSLGPAVGSAIVAGLVHAAKRVGFAVRPDPVDLVASNDPVVSQMEQCIAQGFCVASNEP
jgi:hypothetical protein